MLADSAYGKSAIRLVQVLRGPDAHTVRDLTIAIRFEGDYAPSYRDGDNRDVLPTDTMKNTVYALAARGGVGEPEAFGVRLARHFLAGHPRLARVGVDLAEHAWRPIEAGGRDHPHGFMRRGPDARTASVVGGRDGFTIDAGVRDLTILKTAQSAFAGFLRDAYTTLADTRDRLLATCLTAAWRYREGVTDFDPCWQAVRQTLLETFAAHESRSVQHTLHAMGRAVLESAAEVTSIRLSMPNKHHLPVDLTPFGLENRNEIFVATDEPFGLIEATLVRDDV
jgi:urate oxidase